ncbi:cdc42 effector protein 5 [Polypterus senegalus]
MPILKPSRSSGNGVGGSQRRVRLNAAMISAPLGDFRHTMHVGRGGDAFGDTSFLSNHGPAKDPESPQLTPSNNNNHHTPPMSARNPENEVDSFNASVKTKATNNNGISKSGDMEKVSDGGFGRKEECNVVEGMSSFYSYTSPLNSPLKHSESILSFSLDLDLGPSMLGDVLGVMEKEGGGVRDMEWMDENCFPELSPFQEGSIRREGTAQDQWSTRLAKPDGQEASLSQDAESANGTEIFADSTPTESPDHTPTNRSHTSSVSSEYEGVTEKKPIRAGSQSSAHRSESEGEESTHSYTFEDEIDEMDDEIGL